MKLDTPLEESMTKRLTDAEIEDCLSEVDTTLKLRYVDKMFARAIESAVLERSKAEPVYQVAMVNGPANTAWIDVDDATYTSARLIPNEYKTRALYTAQQAVKAEPVTTSYAEARSALCVEANKLTAPQDVNQMLLAALKEIDNWLVCGCIATPEDMAQSFGHMEQVARAAIAAAERGEA
jgi:hypothetical protein